MLELGIAGGRAVPLQKRTVGNTNISDVFDGVNHNGLLGMMQLTSMISIVYS